DAHDRARPAVRLEHAVPPGAPRVSGRAIPRAAVAARASAGGDREPGAGLRRSDREGEPLPLERPGGRDNGRDQLTPYQARAMAAARRRSRSAASADYGEARRATSKRYTRAVLPPAILACSSSGTPARISARIFRDCGNVDSLCG